MRLTRLRTFALIIIIGITLWIIRTFTTRLDDVIEVECAMTNAVREHITEMAKQTYDILHSLNVHMFLCYGTLWGQLRKGDLLLWDRSFDYCAMNEQLSRYDELYMLRLFNRHDLSLEYDSAQGVYTIWNESKRYGTVRIYVFESVDQTTNVRRVGWKHRILPPTSQGADVFPKWIVEPPLPKRTIGSLKLPVPREGAEIQKYHYPDNWWKEVVPEKCR